MKLTSLRSFAIGSAALAVAIGFSSCTQYQQQGAALGALGGAAIGGLAGDDSGDVIRGAAIGAAAGAGAAALKEESDRRAGYYNSGGDQPPPQPAKPKQTSGYPLATPIEGKPGQVISPYKPHNVIDVRGYRSGQLARDPSTAPIDKETGKSDINQARIFEIP
jgi:hypothetical protein